MNVKNKEPIQAALDSLEMALEHLEDQEEYTLNDVSIKDLWDIWEEASHQLGMSDDTNETKHFADGFHEGEWEKDMRPWPGLDQVLKDIDVPEEWESVKTMTYDEFVEEYGELKETPKTDWWIYESPDGGKTIFRRPPHSTIASEKEEIDWETKKPTGRLFSDYNNGNWRKEDES